jgi:hypothetical protein
MESTFGSQQYLPSRSETLKRMNRTSPERIAWFLRNPAIGSISPDEKQQSCTYSSMLRHNFTNMSSRQERVAGGKTHVAVGFVDLHFLLWPIYCDLQDGPVRFVGYDSSPFAVAKSLLILQLLKMDASREEAVRSILQVWYSASWERNIYCFVKKATSQLVMTSAFAGLPDSVQKILARWAKF